MTAIGLICRGGDGDSVRNRASLEGAESSARKMLDEPKLLVDPLRSLERCCDDALVELLSVSMTEAKLLTPIVLRRVVKGYSTASSAAATDEEAEKELVSSLTLMYEDVGAREDRAARREMSSTEVPLILRSESRGV